MDFLWLPETFPYPWHSETMNFQLLSVFANKTKFPTNLHLLQASLVMQRPTWHCSQRVFYFSCFLRTFFKVVRVSLKFSTSTTYYYLYSPPKLISKAFLFLCNMRIPKWILRWIPGFWDGFLDYRIQESRIPGFPVFWDRFCHAAWDPTVDLTSTKISKEKLSKFWC